MRILKFGGSSVGNVERIEQVIAILKSYVDKKKEIAVVFSAFHGVTDQLIDMSNLASSGNEDYVKEYKRLRKRHHNVVSKLIPQSKQKSVLRNVDLLLSELNGILKGLFLLRERTDRTLDYVVSFGERLSCLIIAETLKVKNINANYLDSRQLIKTDNSFGDATVNYELTNKNIVNYFKKKKQVNVITGFIASTEDNVTTTLGRGGSDYTAAIFGAALNADEVEIWTDVDGILTADPREVNDSYSLKAVTYEEAMEMSHFGAKVIYPPTMIPVRHKDIKIRIKNTFNPSFPGTVIIKKEPNISFNAKGISSISNVSLLRIDGTGMTGFSGLISRIFSALNRIDINIYLITQGSSGHSLCLAVQPESARKAKEAIEREFRVEIFDNKINKVIVEDGVSIIAVVGEDMQNTIGIAGKVFSGLGKNGVNIIAIAQGSSELNISLVIKQSDLKKALNVLHDSLFLAKKKVLNLYLIGPGLVGSALIKYIQERQDYLERTLSTSVKLVGLANSKKMLFDLDGISLARWKTQLSKSNEKANVKSFISRMKEYNLSNTVFIDCTAGDEVNKYYLDVLNASISIATPNKIANTRKYKEYNQLKETAALRKVQFRYGTNVGAGLPIISNLRDLISNGDEIVKIEGVLSGTLSYIFNKYRKANSFSNIIVEARDKGFTEPDPRDDLNGLDFARKLLILIRESGIEFELKDMSIENLIPNKLRTVNSVSTFLEQMKDYDKEYLKRKEAAEKKGFVLSYIAKYEKGIAKVGIEEINNKHPFYNLSSNDNIVAFTTKNYSDKPLIIRGPGAGAVFTASGVFVDILRISNYLG